MTKPKPTLKPRIRRAVKRLGKGLRRTESELKAATTATEMQSLAAEEAESDYRENATQKFEKMLDDGEAL